MKTRSFRHRRPNPEKESDRLSASVQPRAWSDPYAPATPPLSSDFSHVDLFTHAPQRHPIQTRIQRRDPEGDRVTLTGQVPGAEHIGQAINQFGKIKTDSADPSVEKTIYSLPSPSSPKLPFKLKHNTTVIVKAFSQAKDGWVLVEDLSGQKGWSQEAYVRYPMPDPQATLHYVTESNLTEIIRGHAPYKQYDIRIGDDERSLVMALVVANEGTKGVRLNKEKLLLSKLTKSSLKSAIDAYYSGTHEIYQSAEVVPGTTIWLPGIPYINELKSSGIIPSRPEWMNDAITVGKGIGGFTVGLFEGVGQAFMEIVEDIADLLNMLISVVTGEAFEIAGDLIDAFQKMTLDDVIDLAGKVITGIKGFAVKAIDSFVYKWQKDPHPYRKWNFRGTVIGYILGQVAQVFLGPAAAKVAGKILKWIGSLGKIGEKIARVANKVVDKVQVLTKGRKKANKPDVDLDEKKLVGAGSKPTHQLPAGSKAPLQLPPGPKPPLQLPPGKTAKEVADQVADRRKKITDKLNDRNHPKRPDLVRGDPGEIQQLLNEHGNWRELMETLSNHPDADMKKVAQHLAQYRENVLSRLDKRFGARIPGSASTELVSDVDLIIEGSGAGKKLIEAEEYMRRHHGENWSEKFRMNFYTDVNRLTSYESVMGKLDDAGRAAMQVRITEVSEKFNFSRMLHHAGDDPAAIARVEKLIAESGAGLDLGELKKVAKTLDDPTVRIAKRNQLLKEVDHDVERLNRLAPDSPDRPKLAQKISEKQIEANFYTEEAYIGPGAARMTVKGAKVVGQEAYQSVISDLEMIEHIIKQANGDVVKAAREYELFKYVNRVTAAAKSGGQDSLTMTYFNNLSEYIYKRNRGAHKVTSHLNTPEHLQDMASDIPVTDEFLRGHFDWFMKEAYETAPKLRKGAMDAPAAWAPSKPKLTAPTAGNSPSVPKAQNPKHATASGEITSQSAKKPEKETHLLGGDLSNDRLLKLSVEDFKTSKAAQEKLFTNAQAVRDRQQAMADGLLAELGIQDGAAKSILKRDNFDEFVSGVIGKCERNKYSHISQMDDIVRGRFDLPDDKSVAQVANALKERFEIVEFVAPRRPQAGGGHGYPRYHIIVKDPATGMTHEWQIGTKAVTQLYESPGIKIPEALKPNFRIKSDLHDVEYDVFKGVKKKDPALAEALKIPEFSQKVDRASAIAGKGTLPEFESLHQEASEILQKLVDLKGTKFVEQFYH